MFAKLLVYSLTLLPTLGAGAAAPPTLNLPWGVYQGQPMKNDSNVGKLSRQGRICFNACASTNNSSRFIYLRTFASVPTRHGSALRPFRRGQTQVSSPSAMDATVSRSTRVRSATHQVVATLSTPLVTRSLSKVKTAYSSTSTCQRQHLNPPR